MNHSEFFRAVLSLCPGARFSVVDSPVTVFKPALDDAGNETGEMRAVETGAFESELVWDADNQIPQPSPAAIAAEHDRLNSAPVKLAALRAAKRVENAQAAEALAQQVTAGYPEFEKQTWEAQRLEAIAWQNDHSAPTPRIDAMAGYRGVPRAAYLERTVAKVDQFEAVSNYLVGTRQKYDDQIAAADSAALEAMQFVYTLPA